MEEGEARHILSLMHPWVDQCYFMGTFTNTNYRPTY